VDTLGLHPVDERRCYVQHWRDFHPRFDVSSTSGAVGDFELDCTGGGQPAILSEGSIAVNEPILTSAWTNNEIEFSDVAFDPNSNGLGARSGAKKPVAGARDSLRAVDLAHQAALKPNS
jgi:hypothetical protein